MDCLQKRRHVQGNPYKAGKRLETDSPVGNLQGDPWAYENGIKRFAFTAGNVSRVYDARPTRRKRTRLICNE